jgi:hypothetical protein
MPTSDRPLRAKCVATHSLTHSFTRQTQGPGLTVAVCCNNCSADPECDAFTLHGDGNSCLFSTLKNAAWPAKAKGITCGTKQPLPGPGPAPSPPAPPPAPPSPPSPPPGKAATFVADVPANLGPGDEMYFGRLRQWPARYPNGGESDQSLLPHPTLHQLCAQRCQCRLRCHDTTTMVGEMPARQEQTLQVY